MKIEIVIHPHKLLPNRFNRDFQIVLADITEYLTRAVVGPDSAAIGSVGFVNKNGDFLAGLSIINESPKAEDS